MGPAFASKIYQPDGASYKEVYVITTYTSLFSLPWTSLSDAEQDSFETLVAQIHIEKISLESLEPSRREAAKLAVEQSRAAGWQLVKAMRRAVASYCD